MERVNRGAGSRRRGTLSFLSSASVHASALAWVALSPALPPKHPTSLYDQEIRPNQNRIIWYSLKDPLPEISPAEPKPDRRLLRARTKSDQHLVAGVKETNHKAQLIWTPAPQVDIPQTLPSPNLVALARPARPVRSFEPVPVARPAAAPPVVLPSAPSIQDAAAPPASALPLTVAKAVRPFQPPPANRAPVPSAPVRLTEPPPDSPPERPREIGLAIVSLFPVRNPEIPAPKASQQAEFSAGPEPRTEGGNALPAQSQLSVPGLLARNSAADPTPQALLASLDAPTSRRNLMAAARNVNVATAPALPEPTGATRVASPPDPRFQGRVVYAVAIQMPNITSYSGSWIVWFAEHQPETRPETREASPDVRAPLPLRKVDPKYLPGAIEDKVEGKVRLAAVIRKDGSVDAVELLRGLDSRLDQTAQEALAKWEFEPATLNGQPIDVDAVFEIPFRLAPRLPK